MKLPSKSLFGCLLAVSLSLVPGLRAQMVSPTVIYTFPYQNSDDLVSPYGTLISDGAGNFYGTTQYGGDYYAGSVYKVTPTGGFTTVYSFGGDRNGLFPASAVVLGGDGNLYGTTYNDGGKGFGTVYKLSPTGVLTTLYAFNRTDGREPAGSLVFGTNGNLYGTTASGGTSGLGTVFSITTGGVLTTLHNFVTGDGTAPQSALTLGSDGNFYGTTAFNGTSDNHDSGPGSVFKITPAGVFTVLHSFNRATDGAGPFCSLVQGGDGNFYGANARGGANATGTIFKITPTGMFTVLHTFTRVTEDNPYNTDGASPQSALIDGGDGKFYSLTYVGGTYGTGTVFSITPDGTLTTLYSFPPEDYYGENTVGAEPFAGFFRAGDGNLYVPLPAGGAEGEGTVAAFALGAAPSPFFAGEVALSNGVYYLQFTDGVPFGYYSFLSDPGYIYHFDLGYEYVLDANDGQAGVYLYDFKSGTFFYTSPTFPFPYLYDFTLKTVLYYYPNPAVPGHYTTNPRYFYDFANGQIITK